MIINDPRMWRFLIPWKPVNQVAEDLVSHIFYDVIKTKSR